MATLKTKSFKSILPLGAAQKRMTTYDYKNYLVYRILDELRMKSREDGNIFYEGTVFFLKDKCVNSLKIIATYHEIDL